MRTIEAVGKPRVREILQVRIGVATGLVVVGDLIGSGDPVGYRLDERSGPSPRLRFRPPIRTLFGCNAQQAGWIIVSIANLV
jgi:hypothetical protein